MLRDKHRRRRAVTILRIPEPPKMKHRLPCRFRARGTLSDVAWKEQVVARVIAETRRTVQKDAVRRALEDSEGFVSAQQLHDRLSGGKDPVGLATVYRQLGALAEAGQVDTIALAGERLYRACTVGEHHHHLVCENCGKAVDIDLPSEDWIRAIAAQHGYTVTAHVLEVFGRCPECALSS